MDLPVGIYDITIDTEGYSSISGDDVVSISLMPAPIPGNMDGNGLVTLYDSIIVLQVPRRYSAELTV